MDKPQIQSNLVWFNKIDEDKSEAWNMKSESNEEDWSSDTSNNYSFL